MPPTRRTASSCSSPTNSRRPCQRQLPLPPPPAPRSACRGNAALVHTSIPSEQGCAASAQRPGHPHRKLTQTTCASSSSSSSNRYSCVSIIQSLVHTVVAFSVNCQRGCGCPSFPANATGSRASRGGCRCRSKFLSFFTYLEAKICLLVALVCLHSFYLFCQRQAKARSGLGSPSAHGRAPAASSSTTSATMHGNAPSFLFAPSCAIAVLISSFSATSATTLRPTKKLLLSVNLLLRVKIALCCCTFSFHCVFWMVRQSRRLLGLAQQSSNPIEWYL